MDTRTEYPQYYHVEDIYGNVFALVCKENERHATVILKSAQKGVFIISQTSSDEALKNAAPGQHLGCTRKDYQEVLINDFGFQLSDDVLDATILEERQNADAKSNEPTDKTIIEHDPGSGAEGNAAKDQEHDDGSIEQPDPGSAKNGDVGNAQSNGGAGKDHQASTAKQAHSPGSNSEAVKTIPPKQPKSD